MKIIILGGNQVGGNLAKNLIAENHDITVIDIDKDKLHELSQHLDIQTVHGFASHPNILEKAGAQDADLLVAVTSNDEVNLIACQAAYSLFNIPTKIARIRAEEYLDYPQMYHNDHLPVDVFINPDQLITDHIKQLIEHPGALQVLNFSKGKVKLVAITPRYGGPLVNKTIAEIYKFMPVKTRIVAIYQGDHPITPDASTIIQVADEVFFLTEDDDILTALAALGRLESPYQHIMIAGSKGIGLRLAKALEDNFDTKIIEKDKDRAEEISAELDETIVLNGDPTNRELLINENIDAVDVFCALTDNDETNIMACMLAKRLGARRVMAMVRQTSYTELIEGGEIDIALSPQQTTISSILRYVRQGDIVNVHALRRGAAEAIEIIAHGDKKTSKIVGRKLGDIKLPQGATIGAIVRGDDVLMAEPGIVVESDDHVILFVVNTKRIADIEKLFQVSLGFFNKVS